MQSKNKPLPPKRVKSKKSEPKDDSIRLNKFIAESGYCSRRKADEFIAEGAVKVNKKVVTELGTKVHPGDIVTVKGDPVSLQLHNIYIALNKPKNIITTTSDELGRKTVLDIVKKHSRIFPVGRLDRNTTGIILLTNDGEFAYRLTHPKFRVMREYHVKLDKQLKVEDAEKIVVGVELEDGKTAPCELFINPEDHSKVAITLTEGKNHEVKRIFEHFNYEVKQLDRKMFAGITTKGLAKGEYRHLSRKELQQLKKMLGLPF